MILRLRGQPRHDAVVPPKRPGMPISVAFELAVKRRLWSCRFIGTPLPAMLTTSAAVGASTTAGRRRGHHRGQVWTTVGYGDSSRVLQLRRRLVA